MKSTPAFILRNCALWFKGDIKVGQSSQMTIPSMKIKTESFRNAGMIAEREISMGGYEREVAKFKETAFDPQVISSLGFLPGVSDDLMITGALVDEDGVTNNATAYMRGFLKGVDFGDWASGEKAEIDTEYVWHYLKLEVGGQELIEADDFDLSLNGVSQTGDIRSALLI